MSDANDIIAKLCACQNTLDEFGVTKIGVFGSFARGTPRDDSTIDLLVEFSSTPGLFKLARLHQALEEKFGKGVDLATCEMLPDGIKENILKEVIFKNEGART